VSAAKVVGLPDHVIVVVYWPLLEVEYCGVAPATGAVIAPGFFFEITIGLLEVVGKVAVTIRVGPFPAGLDALEELVTVTEFAIKP
jgi:hypothetical protein